MISYQPIELKNNGTHNHQGSSPSKPNDLESFKDKIQLQEKNKQRIKKIKAFKLTTLLLLSHLLVYLLALPEEIESTIEKKNESLIELKIMAKNYAHSSKKSPFINIDVYNADQKLILSNVTLLNQNMTTEENEESELSFKLHEIKIPKDQAEKILTVIDQRFLFFPAGVSIPKKTPLKKDSTKPKILRTDPYQKKWELS